MLSARLLTSQLATVARCFHMHLDSDGFHDAKRISSRKMHLMIESKRSQNRLLPDFNSRSPIRPICIHAKAKYCARTQRCPSEPPRFVLHGDTIGKARLGAEARAVHAYRRSTNCRARLRVAGIMNGMATPSAFSITPRATPISPCAIPNPPPSRAN